MKTMMRIDRHDAGGDGRRELTELLNAAAVCGCAACRHAARVRLIKDQANSAFTRALANLARVKLLSFGQRCEDPPRENIINRRK